MHCFPSLLVFLACCPSPELVPWDEVAKVCPPEQLPSAQKDACCGPTGLRAELVMQVLHGSGLAEFRGDSAERQHTLQVLERLLLDFDPNNVEVWKLLAAGSATDACLEADSIMDAWAEASQAQAITSQALFDFLQRSEAVSRRLTKAALRLETLQQHLLGWLAVHTARAFPEVDPEELRPDLAELLPYYESVIATHKHFAFEFIPELEELTSRRRNSLLIDPEAPTVNLLVLNLGRSAAIAFATLWSLLKRRTVPLRVFVLGDPAGLKDWQVATEQLGMVDAASSWLQQVAWEYVDFTSSPKFQEYIGRFPAACGTGALGRALLARLLGPELLPADVRHVIALDVGDVLVLDDIRELWAEFAAFEEHELVAAAEVPALHHISGGLVLYNLAKMRMRNWTAMTLEAAKYSLETTGDCIHDQSILNSLHHYALNGGERQLRSPVRILSCHSMLVPALDWQLFWNSPEMFLPEMQMGRRYPGLVSSSHFQTYCPDGLDLLSGASFFVGAAKARNRQAAIAQVSRHQQCSKVAAPSIEPRCCLCRERALLVHIPGDMKQWPFVRSLLKQHLPPVAGWEEMALDEFDRSLTRSFWARPERLAHIEVELQRRAGQLADMYGQDVCFRRSALPSRPAQECCTVQVGAGDSTRDEGTAARKVGLTALLPPFTLDVEMPTLPNAYIMMGDPPKNSLEVVMGLDGGHRSVIQWKQDNQSMPMMSLDGSPQKDASLDSETTRVTLGLGTDGQLWLHHGTTLWGFNLPEEYFQILNSKHWSLSIAGGRTWTLCLEARVRAHNPSDS